MSKRALLIGCNYPGSEAELLGCANDVGAIKTVLQDLYGFVDEDFTVMVDTDPEGTQPTANNIKHALKQLVDNAEVGDVLFVHFSGHGIQLPDEEGGEEDNLDEAIVPSDYNPILDDDLRKIIQGLKKGVPLTFTTDCCHSGGLLDHAEVAISQEGGADKRSVDLSLFWSSLGMKPKTKSVDVGSLGVDKVKNRSLPVDQFLSLIAQEGVKRVDRRIRRRIYDRFGEDASEKIKKYLNFSIRAVDAIHKEGCLMTLTKFFCGRFFPHKEAAGTLRPEFVMPPKKPPKQEHLQEDIGLLITACQASERSADVNLSKDKSQTFGAMTTALVAVLRQHHKKNPGVPISNRDLVLEMRAMLAAAGFAQHACLECSNTNADKGFVTWVDVK